MKKRRETRPWKHLDEVFPVSAFSLSALSQPPGFGRKSALKSIPGCACYLACSIWPSLIEECFVQNLLIFLPFGFDFVTKEECYVRVPDFFGRAVKFPRVRKTFPFFTPLFFPVFFFLKKRKKTRKNLKTTAVD